MKKTWEKPSLEVLDVSMTMKHHSGGGDNGNEEEEDLLGS